MDILVKDVPMAGLPEGDWEFFHGKPLRGDCRYVAGAWRRCGDDYEDDTFFARPRKRKVVVKAVLLGHDKYRSIDFGGRQVFQRGGWHHWLCESRFPPRVVATWPMPGPGESAIIEVEVDAVTPRLE